jgi:hypothetical protein
VVVDSIVEVAAESPAIIVEEAAESPAIMVEVESPLVVVVVSVFLAPPQAAMATTANITAATLIERIMISRV